jgi:hypothetical protein
VNLLLQCNGCSREVISEIAKKSCTTEAADELGRSVEELLDVYGNFMRAVAL